MSKITKLSNGRVRLAPIFLTPASALTSILLLFINRYWILLCTFLHLLRWFFFSFVNVFYWFPNALSTLHSFNGVFEDFLFIVGFQQFCFDFSSWISFYSSHLMFVEFLDSINWFISSVLENSKTCLFRYDFCFILALFFEFNRVYFRFSWCDFMSLTSLLYFPVTSIFLWIFF